MLIEEYWQSSSPPKLGTAMESSATKLWWAITLSIYSHSCFCWNSKCLMKYIFSDQVIKGGCKEDDIKFNSSWDMLEEADVLLWRRWCFFVVYATSKTIPLGMEYQIIPSQTPLLRHEKKFILHSIIYLCPIFIRHLSQAKHPYFGPQHPSNGYP